MEKYCKSCGKVFDDLNFILCPYCGDELGARYGRQPIPRKLRHQVFKRDGYRCRECGASKDETSLEIDHIVPVARGGTNNIDNLQTLCRECNRMKHTDEWVGGETDLEVAQNELNNLKKQLDDAEKMLFIINEEDAKIEYRYKIKILKTEYIPIAEKKVNKAKIEKSKIENKLQEKQKKDKLYMKLYVELDYEIIEGLNNYFLINENSTSNALRKIVNKYSEEQIYDAIESIKRDPKLKTKKCEEPVMERLTKLYGVKFCPICGKELPKIANECSVCGTKLTK